MKRGETIIKILMKRDGLTREEAAGVFREARMEFFQALNGMNGRDPEDVIMEELGLEPDYLFEFL